MLLYAMSWIDWSETRWCKVKLASRRFLRSLTLGLGGLVRLVHNDADTTKYHLNGFSKATPQVRYYFSIASMSAAPSEAVLLMLLKDDRFLKFGPQMQDEMAAELAQISTYLDLVWKRLCLASKSETSWQHMRSEAIYATLTGCGFLDRSLFSMLRREPWKHTQVMRSWREACVAHHIFFVF